MYKRFKTINSLSFNLAFAGIILLFNLKFIKLAFSFMNKNSDIAMMLMLPLILFLAFWLLFTLFFLPYLSKALAITLYLISSLSLYFLLSYGTIIDHNMIKNVIQTDSKEVFDLVNIKMIFWLIFLIILPIFYIIRVKIIYSPFKKEFLKRIIIIFSLLAFIGSSFLALSEDYFPFFREHKELEYYLLPSQPIVGLVKYIKKERKKKKSSFSRTWQ